MRVKKKSPETEPSLPHCDELFQRFFDPWYKDADRKRKVFQATRPDVLTCDSLVGVSEDNVGPLTNESKALVIGRIDAMTEAARKDWSHTFGLSGNLDLRWIDAFDLYYTPSRIADVVERSKATNFDNDYVVLCCEFGAVLGHVMLSYQPRLMWYLDLPYWESAVLDPKTGSLIFVFHWAIKKMSGYGVNDGFSRKLLFCLKSLS